MASTMFKRERSLKNIFKRKSKAFNRLESHASSPDDPLIGEDRTAEELTDEKQITGDDSDLKPRLDPDDKAKNISLGEEVRQDIDNELLSKCVPNQSSLHKRSPSSPALPSDAKAVETNNSYGHSRKLSNLEVDLQKEEADVPFVKNLLNDLSISRSTFYIPSDGLDGEDNPKCKQTLPVWTQNIGACTR